MNTICGIIENALNHNPRGLDQKNQFFSHNAGGNDVIYNIDFYFGHQHLLYGRQH